MARAQHFSFHYRKERALDNKKEADPFGFAQGQPRAELEGKICKSREAEIVIVEDDPNDAELLMRVMRKHNLANKLVFMKDGAEALEFLFSQGNNTPKVIFLDLKMPRVDGIEVLRRIRSDSRTKEIPVVILTGSKEERDLKNAHSLGINSYVTKPIRLEQVASVMSELGLD